MYGGVGVGKTMLMDLLVGSATPDMKVARIHYNSFMLDIHKGLREHHHQ